LFIYEHYAYPLYVLSSFCNFVNVCNFLSFPFLCAKKRFRQFCVDRQLLVPLFFIIHPLCSQSTKCTLGFIYMFWGLYWRGRTLGSFIAHGISLPPPDLL
uniref:Uncharacterized protein n=1 Tax=Labrus bergylta TaxID=56723 RepID=A0A3Q3G2C7_9LABR